MDALMSTKYLVFIGLCEAVGGILLIINRFVPLALTILGPVIVNILLTGALMDHRGLVPAIVSRSFGSWSSGGIERLSRRFLKPDRDRFSSYPAVGH